MTEKESANAQESMPVQGKMQSGWYAAQDDEQYLYIDQWVLFDSFLAVHSLKRWYGNEDDEAEDFEFWYSDFDFKGTSPTLFTTKEECRRNEESRQSLIKAKDEMEELAKDNKLIAALSEFNDGDSYYRYSFKNNLERVLGKIGCDYCNLSEKYDKDREDSLLSAIQILREKCFNCSTDRHDKTIIPLSSISRVSKRDQLITVELNTGDSYRISRSSSPRLFGGLLEVFDMQ